MTYYLILRRCDFKPFIMVKDGTGTSFLGEEGYQTFYPDLHINEALEIEKKFVVAQWEEDD